ncbi:MAG: magnesium transporter [Ruminococcaceae bacterium]|nr:magnesium transporter [Oscillospiraceae bacterium]
MSEEIKKIASEESALSRRDYAEELLLLIRSGRPLVEWRELLQEYHDSDIADLLEELTPEERRRLYRVLGTERMSQVFTYLTDVGTYIDELDLQSAADLIDEMDADDAVDLLDELDTDKRQELIELLDEDVAEDIRLIDSYDDTCIGSRMTTNYVAVGRDLTVKQAMRSLIRQAADNDNISTLFVLENDGTFYGAMDLKDLIIAREDTPLEDLIVTSFPFVYATESVEECIEELKEYSEDSIPVLGKDNRLLGVITAHDLVEAVDEELGEDYARLAGLTEQDDMREPLFSSLRKRIPWLLILLLLSLVVSGVVTVFEPVMQSLTLITCFQSLILGMAGNVGTQSLAVTIRVLMDDNLSGREQLQLVFKELRIGLLNGGVLGALSFVCIGVYIWLIQGETSLFAFAASGCIGVSLLLAMAVASLTGTVVPITFKKIGVDPAVASGPLITTINDLVAVVTYYGLAWILLLQVLQLA